MARLNLLRLDDVLLRAAWMLGLLWLAGSAIGLGLTWKIVALAARRFP